MKARQAVALADLAYEYHVTPAQLRACTLRDLLAMQRRVQQERKRRRKGGP